MIGKSHSPKGGGKRKAKSGFFKEVNIKPLNIAMHQVSLVVLYL
jgi:hypothetical protein